MYSCEKYVGKKVVITSTGSFRGKVGRMRKLIAGSYTHGIESLDGRDNIFLHVSDRPEHKHFSWKPFKIRIG